MPKAYSSDLRERLIATVTAGSSRREAAELFDVAISTAVKWLQRLRDTGSSAAKPRGGSTSRLEKYREQILAVVDERPDATLKEILAALGKQRIHTSRSALCRFLGRHNVTRKKKACAPLNSSARTWRGHAASGSASKACLTPPGWFLSMRPARTPT
jgi:transposase